MLITYIWILAFSFSLLLINITTSYKLYHPKLFSLLYSLLIFITLFFVFFGLVNNLHYVFCRKASYLKLSMNYLEFLLLITWSRNTRSKVCIISVVWQFLTCFWYIYLVNNTKMRLFYILHVNIYLRYTVFRV